LGAFSLGLDSRLWRAERREVVFLSENTNAILRTAKLAYLPTAIGADAVGEGSGLMVASNYTGSWWVIASGNVLRLLHVPLGRDRTAAIVGTWSCTSIFGATIATYSVDGTGSIWRSGNPGGSTPFKRSTENEKLRYDLRGRVLTITLTSIDIKYAPEDSKATAWLVQSGATSREDGAMELPERLWPEWQISAVASIHEHHLLLRWTRGVKGDGTEVPPDSVTTCARN
jgi:hypothetical protein